MLIKNLWQFFKCLEIESFEVGDNYYYDEFGEEIKVSNKLFWGIVLKIEFVDIVFVIDFMFVVLVIVVIFFKVGIYFGGMDLGQFVVMFLGGMIGVILMCYVVIWFVELLNKYLGFEGVVFVIVGWVGVKLVVMVLVYLDIVVLFEYFLYGVLW